MKMHADELHIDVPLIRSLLAGQFPQWADLPIERLSYWGTDNAMYRLGNDMVVRVPRIDWAVEGVEDAHEWLPRLAPLLPLAVPIPLGKGRPAEGYPWPWSVYRWLEGANPEIGRLADPERLAVDLAEFVNTLHRIELADGPPSGRGGLLAARDDQTRSALAELREMVDTETLTEVWATALEAPVWSHPPVWVHGDLMPGNLILQRDRLVGVIDFGGVGMGDPACDLIPAWNLLPAGARNVFRDALDVDDATWERGRGWALSMSVIALPYYKETNIPLADTARHVIREVLAEQS
jgi:aminoglycoside phosphotransferase (APT) family kinase protein